MSIRPLLWAKDQTVITTTQRRQDGELREWASRPNALDKLVLIGIADEASEHSWDALIGEEDLAVFVGCTRRAVRESLGRLERAGYLRTRHTSVESGQSGWRRVFLLSAESPLFQGLIEVDFDSVEAISRYQMRTFRDRHQAPFVPSDSLRNRPKPAEQSQEEQCSAPGEGRRNSVPPPRRNSVPPQEEQCSAPQEEQCSAPSSSSSEFFSSPESSDGRTDGSDEEDTGDEQQRKIVEDIVSEHGPALIQQLGAHSSQLHQVRDCLAHALAAGHPAPAVASYLSSKISEARTVRFVLGAFEPHRLNDIAQHAPITEDEPACGLSDWCGHCDPAGRVNPNRRQINDEATDQLRPCPHCHPSAVSDDG